MEKCLQRLGCPIADFSGEEFLRLRAPMVYVWLRDGEVIYVGSSATGLARPFTASHHRLNAMRATDKLLAWACPSRADALRIEARLIEAIKPKFNVLTSQRTARRPWGAAQGVYRDWRDPTTWVLEFMHRGIRYRKSLGRVPLMKARQLAAAYRTAVIAKMSRDKRRSIGKGHAVKNRRHREAAIILPELAPDAALEILSTVIESPPGIKIAGVE